MGKQNWKPGNMLNPVPAVMVSVTDKAGNNNIITVAWAGTVCTNPPMLSISVRPERFSYNMIKETGEFVVNLTTEELLRACDYCGVKSGRDVDKFKELHLTPLAMQHVSAVGISQSPVNIECRVRKIEELGSHLGLVQRCAHGRESAARARTTNTVGCSRWTFGACTAWFGTTARRSGSWTSSVSPRR